MSTGVHFNKVMNAYQITLDRSSALNAINLEMVDSLYDQIKVI